MSDRYYEIRETAGKICRALAIKDAQDVGVLQKEIEVKDAALFNQSLGWLVRETKVRFAVEQSKNQVLLSDEALHEEKRKLWEQWQDCD